MKITTIRFSQKANLGNYESMEVAAEAVLEDGESISESTAKLRKYVDWNANFVNRENKKREFEKELAKPSISEDRKRKIENWIEQYNTLKAEMEAF